MPNKITPGIAMIYVFFVMFCLLFIVPFLIIVSISLSSEAVVLSHGYSLIPREPDLSAYRYVFRNPGQLMDAYQTTIIYSVVGTLLSMLVMTLMAYPLSRQSYSYRRPVSFFVFFTMLFNGGLIPTYILITRYLGLGNSIWVYIVPFAANAFYIIVIRTFFQGLPVSLVESAKIDGSSELRIFFQIVLPISTPVIATISLLTLLARWNDWNTSLIYIKSKNLYSLQYLLQKTLMEAQFIKDMAESSPVVGIDVGSLTNIPTETIKFAMCIVAAGPMLIIFPFFQRYFTAGLTVGAVKG